MTVMENGHSSSGTVCGHCLDLGSGDAVLSVILPALSVKMSTQEIRQIMSWYDFENKFYLVSSLKFLLKILEVRDSHFKYGSSSYRISKEEGRHIVSF